MRKASKSRD